MYNEFGRIQHFKNIETKDDLLYVLNVSSRKYNYLIYQKKNLYASFYINKKQGGFRKILSPCYDLKKKHKELNIILRNNYEFNNETVHGFVKEHSIKTNAIVHKNANYIVNIDLKNFSTPLAIPPFSSSSLSLLFDSDFLFSSTFFFSCCSFSNCFS